MVERMLANCRFTLVPRKKCPSCHAISQRTICQHRQYSAPNVRCSECFSDTHKFRGICVPIISQPFSNDFNKLPRMDQQYVVFGIHLLQSTSKQFVSHLAELGFYFSILLIMRTF